jgi:DNA-binding NtrC family response regulator
MESIQKQRIFIVEDDLLYQQLIAKEMESLSAEIFFYTKGESCVRDLHKNPSIIILDYNLEGEMTGLDALQEIRKFNPSIYVILFSDQKNLDTYENVIRYGFFDYLEKGNQALRLLRIMISSSKSRIFG